MDHKDAQNAMQAAVVHIQRAQQALSEHYGTSSANLELTQAAKSLKVAFRAIADLIIDDYEQEEPVEKPAWFP